MKWRLLLSSVVALFLIVPQAQSQSLIGSYFRCSTANEGEADLLMNTVLGDVYDRHVEAGQIAGWGWIAHQAGGAWRRISTITADDRTVLMTAWGEIVQEIQAEHPNAWHRFNEICDSHDDYLWSQVAASEGNDPAETPDAWISTYYVCNQANESRADEIFQQLSPVIDTHVTAGHLSGWGWWEHDVGGRFRRLLTLAAAPDFDLLDARDMVTDELAADHADLIAEFSSICGSHVDYLWGNARTEDGG